MKNKTRFKTIKTIDGTAKIETSLVDTVVNFKKVKLIESYEVEL